MSNFFSAKKSRWWRENKFRALPAGKKVAPIFLEILFGATNIFNNFISNCNT